METQVSVPVATEQFLELAGFLSSNGDRRDPVLAVADAIDYWIQNASWKPELLNKQTSARGYQWKGLFLPEATELRMPYKGDYFYASVEGDHVMYDGERVTPASWVNRVTQSSRNAWRDVWVKRPGDKEWRLADDIRNEGRIDVAS